MRGMRIVICRRRNRSSRGTERRSITAYIIQALSNLDPCPFRFQFYHMFLASLSTDVAVVGPAINVVGFLRFYG